MNKIPQVFYIQEMSDMDRQNKTFQEAVADFYILYAKKLLRNTEKTFCKNFASWRKGESCQRYENLRYYRKKLKSVKLSKKLTTGVFAEACKVIFDSQKA